MTTSKQLFTQITSSGELKITLNEVEVPSPKPHEVIVKVEAAPINPSDMWPMFGPADLHKAALDKGSKTLSAPVAKAFLPRIKSRLDMILPIGNEGAGVVVAAGDSEQAQALVGKTVGILSGATYGEYCCVPAQACIAHHEGVTPVQAASSFVNPLTALGMVETMRLEGHKGLVHTAAASSLGQMLNKICLAEQVPLVNIVRNQAQADILKGITPNQSEADKLRNTDKRFICDSSSESFRADLYNAISSTGATLAFDAIGGGTLVSDILTTMELVGSADAVGFNTYGSPDNKQVYIYGSLDVSATVLNRAYGMTWGIGGWLLMRFLSKLPPQRVGELHKRVADEINTTFATEFSAELSLEEAMDPATIMKYNAKKTGAKFYINPAKS